MEASTAVYYNLLKSQNFLITAGKGLPVHVMLVYQLQTCFLQTFLMLFFWHSNTITVSVHMH